MMLLCSLPPFHKYFHETLTYGRESLKIDDVKSSLLSCEEMEHDNVDHNDAASGLVARDNWKDVGSSSCRGKSRSKFTYHEDVYRYCKKEGHWKADYPKLKGKKEKDLSDVASIAEDAKNVLSVPTSLVGDV